MWVQLPPAPPISTMFKWLQERRELKAKERAEREQKERMAQLKRLAVQGCLVHGTQGRGSIIIVDVVNKTIDCWGPVVMREGIIRPKSERDIRNAIWWEIDLNHAFNNTRQMSQPEIDAFVDELKLEIND